MAEPKKKTSKGRKGRRRAHHIAEETSVVKCPNCSKLKRPHAVCPSCGKYTNRSKSKNEDTKGPKTPSS